MPVDAIAPRPLTSVNAFYRPRGGTANILMRLAAMNIACFLGRHWPAAALRADGIRDGYQRSACADCAAPMEKMARTDWRAAERPGMRVARRMLSGSLIRSRSLERR